MSRHVFIDGMCDCRGENTRHNERGQIYVYASALREKVIDYYSDVEDYPGVMVAKDPNVFYEHMDEVKDKIAAANAAATAKPPTFMTWFAIVKK